MDFNRRTFLRYGTASAVVAGVGVTAPWALADSTPPWSKLSGRLSGPLVLPGDSGFAAAEAVYFNHFDTPAPAAVAYCTSESDVSACISFAQEHGVASVPRSGGHSHAGFSTTTGLVIDVSRLNAVSLSAGHGGPLVTLGPGTHLVDALSALAPKGYAIVGGSCPTVCAGGFVQGGGYGLLARGHGMSCDRVVSARVVLANGKVVTASEQENPDLYWALRGGGGGNFGIVTEFQVRPVAITQLSEYALTWPFADSLAVFEAWQDWVATAPAALGGGFSLSASPAYPGGIPMLSVSGGWSDNLDALNACLDHLVAAAGAPTTRSARTYTYQEAMMSTYGCGTLTAEQCHVVGTTPEALLPRNNYLAVRNRMFSRPMPADVSAAVVAAFDTSPPAGHTRLVNGAALGGVINDLDRTETAYVHRTTRFQLILVDTIPDEANPDAADQASANAWNAQVFDLIDPVCNGESYQNMPDPALSDWRRSYYAENYPRLTAVKRAYDPYGFFTFPQAIGR